MEHYYVDRTPQSTGSHLVHVRGCHEYLWYSAYLGLFESGDDAVRQARTFYRNVEGCSRCTDGRDCR